MKKLFPALVAIGLAAGCGSKGGADVDLIPSGNRAPAIEIQANFLNTSDISTLEKLKGKVVVMDFWATWCGPCRMEIPGLVQLYRDYHGKGLEILGLSVEINDGRPKEFFDHFIAENQINYPVGLAGPDTLRSYQPDRIPSTFFIDKQGKVALSFVGVHPEAEFIGAVEKLLAEK